MPISVELPDDLGVCIEDMLEGSQFATAGEYIAALVRAHHRAERKKLEAMIQEGLNSPAIEMTPERWAEFEAELELRIAKRSKP